MTSVLIAGLTEVATITSWEKYLQSGALIVLAVVVITFMLKVLPTLLKQLTDQSIVFAEAQKESARSNAEGLKAMANAINNLSQTCAMAQIRLKNEA